MHLLSLELSVENKLCQGNIAVTCYSGHKTVTKGVQYRMPIGVGCKYYRCCPWLAALSKMPCVFSVVNIAWAVISMVQK